METDKSNGIGTNKGLELASTVTLDWGRKKKRSVKLSRYTVSLLYAGGVATTSRTIPDYEPRGTDQSAHCVQYTCNP